MRVLLATDGSDASRAAVDAVRTMTWPTDSEVQVLCVAEPVYAPPPPTAHVVLGGTYADASLLSVQGEQAHEVARAAALQIASAGLTAEPLALLGNPRDAIVDLASDWPADLIVLGSHGRTGLRRWVLGSVAEAVVRHAPCSVLIARPRLGEVKAAAPERSS